MVISDEHLEPSEALERMLPHVLDDDALRAAADAAARKGQIAEARSEQYAELAAQARQEEEAYLQILRLRNDDGAMEPVASSTARASRSVPSNVVVHPVIAASISVLRSENRPLHIGELMRTLREREVEIPGSGEQANLISYLRRDNRIVRPSRGVYALREWGLKDMQPRKRTKTKRGRRKRGRTGSRAGTK